MILWILFAAFFAVFVGIPAFSGVVLAVLIIYEGCSCDASAIRERAAKEKQ